MAGTELIQLIAAIATGDAAVAAKLLAKSPHLAREALPHGATRAGAKDFYFPEIMHYAYADDTALHLAAAAYDLKTTRKLLALGADVHAANRRGATALHYAADGVPDSPAFNPRGQAAVIACLIEHGADPNARDKSGVPPLYRAIRTRCAAAVKALLKGGANPKLKNGKGSTPMDLATNTTGRGGSGSAAARRQQAGIIRLLIVGVSTHSAHPTKG